MKNLKIEVGVELHQKGKLMEAKEIYEEILSLDKKNSEALHLIGVIYYQEEKYLLAIETIQKAIKIKVNERMLNNLGNCLKALGKSHEALKSYEDAIFLNKVYINAYSNKAELLKELHRFDDALDVYDELLKIKKDYLIYINKAIIYQLKNNTKEALKLYYEAIKYDENRPEAYYNIGVIKYQNNEIDEALRYYEKTCNISEYHKEANLNKAIILYKRQKNNEAMTIINKIIEININYKEAYLIKGNIYKQMGEYIKSIEQYNMALVKDDGYIDAYINKGNSLKEINKLKEALENYNKAIEINNKYSVAYTNRGTIYQELRNYEKALEDYKTAIDLEPKNAEAHLNLANTMKFKKEYFKAIDNYKKAIEINPKLAEAYSNLGNIYSEMKRYEEAIYNYEIAMTLNYKIRNVAGNILINKLRICDWENYYEYVKKYKEDNKKYDVINSPFINLLIDDDLKNQKDVTIKYVNELYGNKYYNLNRLQKNNELKIIKGKIKIAYFSADIYYHAVSIWLAALLENHNKNKFEIYLFSLNNKNKDEMHIRIKNSVDHFIEIDSKSDQEIINFCHLSEIDIAIDLNGFTENSRTSLFASRLAAIQVSHIGYPATMGAKFIDYYISDYKSIEEHEREYYEEKIAYIPCTYTYDLERKCLDNNLKRKDYGLPDQSFVFTCQNGSQKINPIIFDTWLEILKEVKGSVLWLMTPNETAQKNLINYAYLRGVNKERIIFSQRKIVPSENEKQRVNEYITSYKLADLFLDTWPYNAGTTAVDALRAGLPIITRKGSSFVSRLASSALYSIDVTELITNSIEEYKTKAIELAHNMDKYNKIKNKIEKNIEISNIFKPNLNTKKIEHAYEEMIKNLKNAKTNKNIFIN